MFSSAAEPKALDQRDHTAVDLLGPQPGTTEQTARDHAVLAQEAVRQDAALEEGVEPVRGELRQAGAGRVLGLGEESLSVLPHPAVQRGLLGTAALVVGRGTIKRPVELPSNAWQRARVGVRQP